LNKIKVLNPLQIENWDDLIENLEGHTFFHCSAWNKALKDAYGFTPTFFVNNNSDKLDMVIPFMEVNSWLTGKRGVSLPFTDSCKVIIKNRSDLDSIFNEIVSYGKSKDWKYFEVRDDKFLINNAVPFDSFYEHYLTLGINTYDLFKSFRSSTKRNIKNAENRDVEIEFTNSHYALRAYYILHCITRKRQGVPPQPYSFFKQIQTHVLKKDKGIIGLAKHNSRIVAGMIFFHFRGKVIYKYGASNYKFKNLRANNLLMWKAIERYNKQNFSEFYFGRTDKDNEGLRQFKMGWRPKEQILNYYRYNLNTDKFEENMTSKNSIFKYFFRVFPLPLLKLSGNYLYKHFG